MMLNVRTHPFDPAKYLESDEDCAFFLKDSLESNDPAVVASALKVIARAKGMTQLARETGIARERLFEILVEKVESEPEMAMEIVRALEPHLKGKAAGEKKRESA